MCGDQSDNTVSQHSLFVQHKHFSDVIEVHLASFDDIWSWDQINSTLELFALILG